MKRFISMLLCLIMVVSLCGSIAVFANDTGSELGLTVGEAQGTATQLIEVPISVATPDQTRTGLSCAELKIKYDPALELVGVTNGNFFANISDSAIYNQETSGVNGEYTYIGYGDGENSNKISGTLVTLMFRIPNEATVGTKYSVEIDKKASKLIADVDTSKAYQLTNGVVKVVNAELCGNHTFSAFKVASSVSYFSAGFSYRTCTVCGHTVVNKNEATKITNPFKYIGVCVNYTGNPSGIAPIFEVDLNTLNIEKIKTARAVENSLFEAGILVLKNGEVCFEEVFFGEGATMELKDNKLFVKMTDVSAYDKFEFKAYVKLTDLTSKEQRVEYTTATFGGKEQISILDVVKGLDIDLYSRSDRTYLKNVLNGLAK